MSDLIRRTDAIEAVVCHIWHMPNEAYRQFNCENMVREVVEDAIKRLPSAEASQDLAEPNKELKGSDLIRREDAIKAIRSTVAQYVPFLNGVNATLPMECEIALRSVPSAEPKTGEWIQKDMCADRFCSECNYAVWDSEAEEYNFCPNCGARMYKGGDDE